MAVSPAGINMIEKYAVTNEMKRDMNQPEDEPMVFEFRKYRRA